MYFDAHTHVQFAAFKGDWKEVVGRALKQNVWLVNVGTQRDTSARAIEVAHEYKEGVYATVGLHPIHTEKSYHDTKELGLPSGALAKGGTQDKAKEFTSRGEDFDYDEYKKLAQDPKVVAIGECGLDYYRLGEETKEKQQSTFLEHIKLAKEVGKPLMIHCRQAFSDLIDILTFHVSHLTPSVVHFFTGTPDDARQLLDLGFSFTFGGVITFARDYDETIKLIPIDRILSETDAPYVAPAPYRGGRNEPAYVIEVVKKLAELKDVSIEEMEQQIFANARRIFYF
ncbi:MAG: TatD family hydrolase [Candidatus Liptonbacteria bacterium]|nr:TatD family hydrolase [Candidatus Liptonbacteria bacterium]